MFYPLAKPRLAKEGQSWLKNFWKGEAGKSLIGGDVPLVESCQWGRDRVDRRVHQHAEWTGCVSGLAASAGSSGLQKRDLAADIPKSETQNFYDSQAYDCAMTSFCIF